MADPRMLSDEQLRQLLGQVRFVYERTHGDPAIDRIKAHIDALTEQLAADEDLLWQCLHRLEYDDAMGAVYRAVRARLEGEDDDA